MDDLEVEVYKTVIDSINACMWFLYDLINYTGANEQYVHRAL